MMWTLSMHAAQLSVPSRVPACYVASGAEDPRVKSHISEQQQHVQ
jgi:hypothetical protein